MTKLLHTILIAGAVMTSTQFVKAQTLGRTVISAAGQTITVPQLTLTYVIGEPVTGTFTSVDPGKIYITAGFLQPEITSTDISGLIPRSLIAFPNPTTDGLVKLDLGDLPANKYTIDIIDALGHVMSTQEVSYQPGSSTNIPLNLSAYQGGTYFLRVRNASHVSGQAKLIKL